MAMQSLQKPSRRVFRKTVQLLVASSLICTAVAVPPPLPDAVAWAAKTKKPKPPKFEDNCKPLRQPFTRIKNYQTNQIIKGAFLGALAGMALGAITARRGEDRGDKMIEGAVTGAISGGLIGYLASLEQVRENQAELQAALGKFDDERAQYSSLPNALVDLANCRNIQVFTVQQQFEAQLLTVQEASKRLDKIEAWVAEDDRIIANAAKSEKESILTYAQANAVADGMSAQEAKDKGDLILAKYETGADEAAGSVELEEDMETAQTLRTTFAASTAPSSPPVVEPAPPAAPPSEAKVYVTAKSGANVRAEPSAKAQVLGQAPFGSTLTKTEGGGPGWTGVIFETRQGFVSSSLLDDEPPSATASTAAPAPAPAPRVRRAPRPESAPIKLVYRPAAPRPQMAKVTRSAADGRSIQAVNQQRQASFQQARGTLRSRLAASRESAET